MEIYKNIRLSYGTALLTLPFYLRVTWTVGAWHQFQTVLSQTYRGLTCEFLLLRIYSVAFSVNPHVCIILV